MYKIRGDRRYLYDLILMQVFFIGLTIFSEFKGYFFSEGPITRSLVFIILLVISLIWALFGRYKRIEIDRKKIKIIHKDNESKKFRTMISFILILQYFLSYNIWMILAITIIILYLLILIYMNIPTKKTKIKLSKIITLEKDNNIEPEIRHNYKVVYKEIVDGQKGEQSFDVFGEEVFRAGEILEIYLHNNRILKIIGGDADDSRI